MTKLRNIAVSAENYKRLQNLGYAGDSFNDVITMLLDKHEKKTKKVNEVVAKT